MATLSADQTGVAANTWTKVNFNTAGYNQNGKFSTSTSRWTPSAGPAQIEAQVGFGSATTVIAISIYKNGTQFKFLLNGASAGAQPYVAISIVDNANGTDYYECWAYSAIANTVSSTTTTTFFQGFAIAPQGPVGPQGPQGTPGPTTPADAFVATLSADQGVSATTWSKLNFNTVSYNQNGKFNTSTSRWTPSAGPVQIEVQTYFNSTSTVFAAIYKNGVQFKQSGTQSTTMASALLVAVDNANGTDFYECYAYSNIANGVASNAIFTFFQGFAIAPQGPAGATGPQGPQGTPGPTTPADAFVATLSADQTGVAASTYTKVNFNVADYNQNGKFSTSTSRWTPSAGPIQIEAQLYYSAGGAAYQIVIYKNGTQFKVQASATVNFGISIVDTANGTDYYECYAYSSVANTILSGPNLTFYQGFAVAPQGPVGPTGPAPTAANAATTPSSFAAGYRLPITIGGTTYYIAASTTPW